MWAIKKPGFWAMAIGPIWQKRDRNSTRDMKGDYF